jgi:hypothetical protein
MAQGYTGYTIVGRDVSIADGPNLDAFSRLRVSNPLTIFANQFTYDASSLIFEQYSSNISVAYATHNSTESSTVISFNGASAADFIYMQSYEYIPYQPGRSQLVFITFNMFYGSSVNNIANRYVGLGDDFNGFFLYYDATGGNGIGFLLRSTTSAGNQVVYQSSWNLDKLNGTGPSGLTVDFTRSQILVIDFQALYVGRVRFGFDIGGQIVYAHEFLNTGVFSYPYIATANLPVRVGMVAVLGNPVDMLFICCGVASEGGTDDALKLGYNFVYGASATITTLIGGGWDYCMQLRPKTTFNSLTNRSKFILTELEFLNVGNRSIKWQLTVGDQTGGGWADVNPNYSAMEYAIGGTYVPGNTIVIDEGYAAATGGSKSNNVVTELANRYPITLDASGNQRDLGTLTLSAQLLAAGSSELYFTMKWKEVR